MQKYFLNKKRLSLFQQEMGFSLMEKCFIVFIRERVSKCGLVRFTVLSLKRSRLSL